MDKERGVQYAKILYDKPVEKFLLKLLLSSAKIQSLVIVSPFIGSLSGTRFALENLNKRVIKERIPTYVITREPEDEYHREGVDVLMKCDYTEVRFNPSIHAKLYVCMCASSSDSFALFGSGNLTRASVERNIELGMMVFGIGQGRYVINELYRWGMVRLRTLPGSKLVKRIQSKRRI